MINANYTWSHCIGDSTLGNNVINAPAYYPHQDNRRLDRIRRFITIIFMAHAGAVELHQDGAEITVIRCATDRKRPNILIELEVPDGIA